MYEDQFFPMGLVIWVNVGNSTADQDVQSNFLQSNFYVIVQIWSWNGALDGAGFDLQSNEIFPDGFEPYL